MTRLVACGLILLIGVIGILGVRMTSKPKDGAKDPRCVDCPEYVKAEAIVKLKVLWDKITSDEYTGVLPADKEVTKPEHWWQRDLTKDLHDFLHTNRTNNLPTKKWFTTVPDFMKKTKEQKAQAANGTMPYVFDRFSDENPAEHTKIIHTYGAVAQVRLEPVNNSLGLTGFFKTGGDYGVIRLSMPGAIEGICKPPYDLTRCLKTSLALKMLRTGDFSSNIFAQTNLGDGVGADFNFFKWNQGSWLPVPGGPLAPIIVDLFNTAATPSNAVGNTEFASEGSTKNQDKKDITAPKLVYFIPNANISNNITSDWHDPRDDFKKIKAGTLLYTIVAPVDDGKKCTADNAGGYGKPTDTPWRRTAAVMTGHDSPGLPQGTLGFTPQGTPPGETRGNARRHPPSPPPPPRGTLWGTPPRGSPRGSPGGSPGGPLGDPVWIDACFRRLPPPPLPRGTLGSTTGVQGSRAKPMMREVMESQQIPPGRGPRQS